jgi:hypothetical protein
LEIDVLGCWRYYAADRYEVRRPRNPPDDAQMKIDVRCG